MNSSSQIIGHQKQLNFLINCHQNQFPHSWIFFGRKGIGKYKTIKEFIKKIYLNETNYHQKVFEINSDESLALIDDIRKLISQINLTNSNKISKKTFIIIDNAELLNFNSLNALLKTIEEPPQDTVIVIITHNLKKLPKTIISRCMRLRFNDLNFNDFKKFCEENLNNLDEKKILELYKVSNGSPGLSKIINSEEGKLINEKTLKMLNQKSFNFDVFNPLYELVSKDYQKYIQIVINCLYKNLKEKFILNNKRERIKRYILIFFSNIEIITKGNINLDKKKELHYLFSQYFILELANE
jgi:DNA polymerase-3 subunit delta'